MKNQLLNIPQFVFKNAILVEEESISIYCRSLQV